ncbi:helix-turn-helix transcriptional regulator [uncultured Mucilaginibacter sp.]|uniref:helix-turn-helix domain-containing protein n=1 Tax=uncultured Mucilaginibacter sp. TaxID=797541 RepID=UPI0025D21B93|nr:helix-turn-helix transcriptional regulator [uncultured Mucilaginibacter sp.]
MATEIIGKEKGTFRVAAIGENKCTLESYNRRDFYKISLVTSGGTPCQLLYGSLKPFLITKPALVFLSPLVPHSWVVPENITPACGYFCVFDEAFVNTNAHSGRLANEIFSGQKSPVYFPVEADLVFLETLFTRMHNGENNEYQNRNDLIRTYLDLIFHEAIKAGHEAKNQERGSLRLAAAFMRLLRQQFPVDLPLQAIKLRTASDFADTIAVHVNHLNTVVQKATGKTTTSHINEQIYAEAKSLLTHTNYTVSEIASCLGFEYQSYFNRFFKRQAGVSPLNFRKSFEKYN